MLQLILKVDLNRNEINEMNEIVEQKVWDSEELVGKISRLERANDFFCQNRKSEYNVKKNKWQCTLKKIAIYIENNMPHLNSFLEKTRLKQLYSTIRVKYLKF